jgi:hypothetical protein
MEKVMLITLDVSNDLGTRLHPFKQELPRLLELGLRELGLNQISQSSSSEFRNLNDVLEFLAKLPSAEEIIALRPSLALQNKMNLLLEKQSVEGLTLSEEVQWQQYEYLEHLVRIAKGNAFLKLHENK